VLSLTFVQVDEIKKMVCKKLTGDLPVLKRENAKLIAKNLLNPEEIEK
jgi:hypothetical protein